MNKEPSERLQAVRRCALAVPANLPLFGSRSQIAWRRSAVASVPVPGPVAPDALVAACIAALSPYRDSSGHGGDLRIGLSRESGGQRHIVPVVAAPPAGDITTDMWLMQVKGAIAESERFFGGLPVEDIELLIGQARSSAKERRTLFSVLVDVEASAGEVVRDQLNDATITVADEGLRLVYDDRLFIPEVADEWLSRLRAILSSLSGRAGLARDALAAAADSRHAKLAVSLPDAPDIMDMIAGAREASPSAPALICEDETVTYGELLARARSVAAWLAARDAGAGQVIGLLAYPGSAFVAGLLGILYHGGVPAVLDVQSPAARLASAVGSTFMPALLTDQGRRGTAEAVVTGAHAGYTTVADLNEIISGQDQCAAGAAAQVAPDAPGYVLFTSGSTGRPKGVVQTRRTLNEIVNWQVKRSGSGSRPRTIQRSALSFDVSLQEIFSTLADGGSLYVLPDEMRHDLSAVARFVTAHGVERMFITPSGLQAMLASASASDLGSLREIICAGEPLLISGTMRRALREIGARLDNQYGPTETHVCVAGEVEGDPFTWPDRPLIGAPLPGITACVVDSQLRMVPVGATGELMVAGSTVALGYLTGSEGFDLEPSPCPAPGRRWYRTGDRVREHPDGRLEFLGRADQQVKIRGYRVELAEIEAAATGTGLTSEAVAFSVQRGDEAGRLGLAVLSPESPIDKAILLTAMGQHLPAYMVPRRGEVTVLDDFPATSSGKVDRQRVVQLAAQRIGEQRHHDRDSDTARLRALWHRTLGVDDSGDDQTFMELGGDSLAAVELAAALQDGFGVTASLREILEDMSFRRLRDLPARASGDAAPPQEAALLIAAEHDIPELSRVELPAFGAMSCLLPTEARHLYLDIVVCGTYAQFGMLDEPLPCVIDVGANIGLFALQILARNPGARLVAIEPHPGLAAALRATVGAQALVVQAACAAKSGARELFTYPDMPAMSSLSPAGPYDSSLMAALTANDLARIGAQDAGTAQRHIAVRPADRITVPARRLSEVLREHELATVSLLKIDVQHGELDVLAGLDDDDWPRVERVVIEVQDVDGQADRVKSALEDRGFSVASHRDDLLHSGCPVTFVYGWSPGARTSGATPT
jgi:amino acid adenylation domain-containing protein/FkbM family methyltransferase